MRKLIVLDGPNRGAVLEIGPGETRIGRERGVELVLPDMHISRHHAAISIGADGATVLADLGSKNATYLNGIRLVGSRALGSGDEVRLGDTTLLYVEPPRAPGDVPAAAGAGVASAGAGAPLDPDGETAGMPLVEAEARPAGAGGGAARFRYLIGESASIRQVSELVQRCAPLATTVLVTGESGTGKELVCEALHRLSPRRQRPLIVVNCATLEPALLESELFGHERGSFTGAVARKVGLLELARDGTLFLDEVGELPLAAQAKLLRAIDRRQFQRVGGVETLTTDARFVAATHRDLAARAKDGEFREDLYFRLKVAEIRIPPLRERREDLGPLIDHFLRELRPRIPSPAKDLTPDAMETLQRYPFPGNVRELRNLLERCLIFTSSERISLEDLPGDVREAAARARPAEAAGGAAGAAPAPGDASGRESAPRPEDDGGEPRPPVASLADIERRHIESVLERTGWNKTHAAQLLGIDRNTLYSKIRTYRLSG